ncbi:prominin-like protein isoform X4 [Amphibalanus amphitrite]|uniref:prominin-like protein isoform X4 n=1 Tax=Amphibalanus amphitrite TaxID=1232801 RepID=UPI001C91F6B2|nr:prominin-like protein isoform X4 [Amphibalanus amphitrite]XP_043200713.1 prominin-like protein isoform X4 [Amphibalanus amphitrite]
MEASARLFSKPRVVSGLVTMTPVVVVVLVLSGAALAQDGVETRSVLPFEPVRYSSPKLNASYRSSDEFDPKGMEHLYYVTNFFLDLIQRDDSAALDRHQLEVAHKANNLTETFVQLGLRDWPTLLNHHLGFAILAALGILVAVLTPFVGMIVCCCRCAGRCGGRTDPYEKKRDKCKRICNGVFLSLLVLLVLFGLVASFVVNEYIEQGVKEVPSRLNLAVDDVELYAQNTKKEVNHLLRDNYRELQSVLDESLDKCGDRVKAKLANISRAVAVDDLTVIAEGLKDIRQDLNSIASQTQRLQERADQLQVGLQSVQGELQQLLLLCNSPTCQQLARQYNLSQLAVQNEFRQWLSLELIPKLPDVTRTAREISVLIENGIEREVRSGKRSFDELSDRIQAEVAAVVPEVRRRIVQAGGQLRDIAANVSSVLDQVRLDDAHKALTEANGYLEQFGPFRYYLYLILSSMVLIITFCLVMGLFCGFCGRRPGNVYGDDTCNKGAGANFLLSGTFFFFLFGWMVLLVVTCMFLVGGLAQFYLCQGLREPESPASGLALLEALLPPEQLFPELQKTGFDLADVIGKCHRNQTIYTVLNLEPLVDLGQLTRYKEELGIDRQLDSLRRQIQVDTNVEILTPRAKKQLYELAESDVAKINYTAFTQTLEDRITAVDLAEMAGALEAAAGLLPPAERGAANRLRNQATVLGAQQEVVDQMAAIVVTLRNATISLQEHVRFNRTNVTEAVRELIGQAESAQLYLSTRGSAEVIQLADEYAAEFLAHLDGYTGRVEGAFRRTVGQCGPLSNVYNATDVTLCSNVVYPFNGYWAALGWCILIFIPCVVVSLVLASLYRKTEPYSETFVDNEYLYDAYGEHDNIPLANVRDQRGAKRSTTAASGGERRRTGNMYENNRYHGYSPDSPPYTSIPPRGQQFRPLGASGDHAEDTDPKAPPLWDLNGGPPGYTDNPAPAGYERPPPYFYPGPGPERS